jgi:hypothetical protein
LRVFQTPPTTIKTVAKAAPRVATKASQMGITYQRHKSNG